MHLDSTPSFDSDVSNPPSTAAPASLPSNNPQPRPIAKLAAALAKAQGDFVAPLKNRSVDFQPERGPRVKYNYADLADVIESFRKPLAANGLALTHILEYSKHGFGLTTRLIHESGESVSTWYPLPDPAGREMRPQQFGSALTYARRYSVSALLGIASEEDDDGHGGEVETKAKKAGGQKPPVSPQASNPGTSAASKPEDGANPPAQAQGAQKPKAGRPDNAVSQAQLKRLFAIATEQNWSTDQLKIYMIARWEVQSSKDLTRDQYDALVSTVQRGSFQQARAMLISQGVADASMPEG